MGSACPASGSVGLGTRAEAEFLPDVETDSASAVSYVIPTRGPSLLVLPPKTHTLDIVVYSKVRRGRISGQE